MTMQCCLNIVETGNQPQVECNLFMSAMKELAAFFTAIDNLFGTEQARRSALNWIEELESIDWQIEDSMPNWRQATVAASALLNTSHCTKVSQSGSRRNAPTFPPEIEPVIPR